MSTVELPLRNDALVFGFLTTLGVTEPRDYQFIVFWNTQDLAWYMDVRDTLGTPIKLGVKLVLGQILDRHDARLPPGQFFLVDMSDENLEAGVDDLGSRVKLFYREDL